MVVPAIFISYRHSDAADEAGRLRDALSKRWGMGVVFQDSASIRTGALFPHAIRAALSSSSVVVAVIGPQWSSTLHAKFNEQSNPTDDWVREELAYAFAGEINVFPVLVRNAKMPSRMELPPSISTLADTQFFCLSHESFELGVELLASAIEELIVEKYDSAWLRFRKFSAAVFRSQFVRPILWFGIAAILGAATWVIHYYLFS